MIALDKYLLKFKLIKARLMLGFFIIIAFDSCTQKPNEVVIEGLTMGTSYTIKIITQESKIDVENIPFQIDSILVEINNQMSTYIENSEINRFNFYTGTEPFELSPEFYSVVKRALFWTEKTNGAFDVTILPLVSIWGFGPGSKQSLPSENEVLTALNYSGYQQLTLHLSAVQKKNPNVQLDVNAIAKGFGVDEVSAFFGKNGLNNYMVEIGGEVYCKGVNEEGEIWRIGIESPNLNDTDFMNIVSLKNRAMASSGDYRNYYSSPSGNVTHIVDPRTGQPVSEIAATTVIAENCMDADALATALMVLGVEKGLILIEQLDKVEGMVVKRNENMELEKIYSSGFKSVDSFQ